MKNPHLLAEKVWRLWTHPPPLRIFVDVEYLLIGQKQGHFSIQFYNTSNLNQTG